MAIKTRINMAQYEPKEMDVPSGTYLVRLTNIDEKDGLGANKLSIYENELEILNGVDHTGKKVTWKLHHAIFLGNEYTNDSIYRTYSAFGLSKEQMSNIELAIGQLALLEYTCKDDVAKADPSKENPFAKFKFKKYDNAPVAPVIVKGMIKQAPVMQQGLNSAPMHQMPAQQAPVYQQQVVQPTAPAYVAPQQQAPVQAQQSFPGFAGQAKTDNLPF